MKMAAVKAIAALAREEPSDVAAQAYGGVTHLFGPNYLIPSPFDQRLILRIAPAVAKAAMDAGLATRPITDFDAYLDGLNRFVFRSGFVMKPMTSAAKRSETKARVIYADGEDERVMRAAQVLIEENIATPILIGRPSVIDTRLERYGLKIRADKDFQIVDPNSDPRFKDYVDLYFKKVGRKGVGPDAAKTVVRTNSAVIGALAVERGDADALICGLDGRFERHRKTVLDVIGVASNDHDLAALSMLINTTGTYFLTDTYVTNDPSPHEIANATKLSADHIRRFGLVPKAALLSASNFGSRDIPSAEKMRKVLEILREEAPDLQVDGEMHGDSALSGIFREKSMPNSTLTGEANLLVFPTLDSAHIAMSIIRAMTDALHVGPILLGAAKPAHILTPSVTSRGVVNMSTLAAVEAMSVR